MASFASSATTGGARKHAWTNFVKHFAPRFWLCTSLSIQIIWGSENMDKNNPSVALLRLTIGMQWTDKKFRSDYSYNFIGHFRIRNRYRVNSAFRIKKRVRSEILDKNEDNIKKDKWKL